MQRKKKLIVGNWKMNPQTLAEAKRIFSAIRRRADKTKRSTVVICPPDIYLLSLVKNSGSIPLGTQNVFWEDQGFHTGQISPLMARHAGATFSIIGHSEARSLGETDAQVALKLAAVVHDGLEGIVCVGERTRDDQGHFYEVLKSQLLASLAGVPRPALARHIAIAYEPIWAIGRADMRALGATEVREALIFIRKVLTDVFGRDVADAVPLLYGGSVAPENAGEIVFSGDADGLLIGRDSLDPELFSEILREIDAKQS